jgi:branched-chain amino acid transport system ATP-binding protein
MPAVLTVDDVYTAYAASQVLFGVSLQVAQGECVCLLGRNGVGKTTTIRTIMGLTPPSRGCIAWRGKSITGKRPYQVARLGIGFVPEDRRIFSDLTVIDNLEIAAGRDDAEGSWTLDRVFDLFPELRELADRRGGYLSGGQQQMLTIARTLMTNPELLLLDEPSEGLAPLVIDRLREQIARLRSERMTILLAEQNVQFSLALADRVYILEKGRIRYEGTAESFRADPSLQHRFLAV